MTNEGLGSLMPAAFVGVLGFEQISFVEAARPELSYGVVAAVAVHYELRDHAANDGGELEPVSAESGRPV